MSILKNTFLKRIGESVIPIKNVLQNSQNLSNSGEDHEDNSYKACKEY